MAFLRIRFPGMWGVGSVVSSAEWEAIDAMRPDAIDGGAGGTYAPTGALVIGGLETELAATDLTISATAMAVSAPGTWTAAQTHNAAVTFNSTITSAGANSWAGAQTFSAASSILLSMTQPASNADPGASKLYSTNVEKAWGNIVTDGAGSYTVNDGFNIDSCTITATYVEVTWRRAFANANYAPTVTCNGSGIDVIIANINFAAQTTAKTRIFFTQLWGGVSAINPATLGFTFVIRVSGRH